MRALSVLLTLCWFVPLSAAELPTKPEDVQMTGKEVPELAALDEMMRKFLAEQEIPGASLAVAKDGRLVYARGFGWANVEKEEPVLPDNLFRIASISKPITAVVILQLVEQGKLKLSDKVFEIIKAKPPRAWDGKPDPRLAEITIEQCLQHTGGWDRDVSGDPMFKTVEIAQAFGRNPPASPEQVIGYMHTQPLDFDPGTKYAYSNFGYCLLGRVIEKLTRKTYERATQELLLKPRGITEMRIGKTALEQQKADTVYFYTRDGEKTNSVVSRPPGKLVEWPYGGWYLEAMDAHGGWLASAPDLVRFAVAIDQPEKSKILTPESIQTMFAPPPGKPWRDDNGQLQPVWYGLGWSVRNVDGSEARNTWHTGSLDGTSTLLVRRHDGYSYAILFNTRQTKSGQRPSDLIDPLSYRTISEIATWPTHDLFETAE